MATEAQRAWYLRNKESVIARSRESNRRYAERNRKFVRDYKESRACVDCGASYHFSAMDFDHISEDKDATVARLAGDSVSIARIEAEIAKCELVCAVCHRIRTWARLQADVAE